MAQALGLNLVSPPEFMQAVAEGNDPPAQTVAQFHDLVAGKKIKLLVYNVQASTNITEDLKRLAANNAIPVVGISETLQPVDSRRACVSTRRAKAHRQEKRSAQPSSGTLRSRL